MKKYSKKNLAIGILCLTAGVTLFLYGALVVASSDCPSCQNIAFLVVFVSILPLLIGIAITVGEFEKYIKVGK